MIQHRHNTVKNNLDAKFCIKKERKMRSLQSDLHFLRQNEGSARTVVRPDLHTVATQKATRTQASAKWGAVAGRRMSAGAGGRSDSGARSHAESGARVLGGIDQAGARTNDEMRQYAPPQHEARSTRRGESARRATEGTREERTGTEGGTTDCKRATNWDDRALRATL